MVEATVEAQVETCIVAVDTVAKDGLLDVNIDWCVNCVARWGTHFNDIIIVFMSTLRDQVFLKRIHLLPKRMSQILNQWIPVQVIGSSTVARPII